MRKMARVSFRENSRVPDGKSGARVLPTRQLRIRTAREIGLHLRVFIDDVVGNPAEDRLFCISSCSNEDVVAVARYGSVGDAVHCNLGVAQSSRFFHYAEAALEYGGEVSVLEQIVERECGDVLPRRDSGRCVGCSWRGRGNWWEDFVCKIFLDIAK